MSRYESHEQDRMSGEVVSVQPCIDRLRSFIYVPDHALNYGLIHE
jgi:hypothetical protein